MADQTNLDRREFVSIVLAFLGAIMAGVVGLPGISYLISPATKVRKSEAWIPAGKLKDYEVGKPTLFSFTRSKINGWEKTVNSYGIFVVKESEESAKAYSNRCTHLSCRVNWKEDLQEYVCPCHDGHFNIQGMVTAGPPPRSLDMYETKLEDGALFVFLKEA